MNRSAFFGAALLAFGLGAASGQTDYVQTSKIVGMKVKDSNGEAVGTIKDVVLNRESGCIAYTVLSTGDSGTRLTGTTKTVAIPWPVYSPGSDPSSMTLTVDRERVYGAPGFEYSRINEYSASYINDVYSYYGVQPSTNASPGPVSTFSPDVSSQATATASPTATATPSPTPIVTPAATPTPSISATISRSPTAKSRPPWAADASRASATPSANIRKSPSESSADETDSKGRHRRESVSPTPIPSPEETPE